MSDSKKVEKVLYDKADIEIIKQFLLTINVSFARSKEAAMVIDAIERGKIADVDLIEEKGKK